LQSGLEARTSRRGAVVITALAFAAYHLRFDDPMLFAAQFCYGLVWGALRSLTRSLYASSTAHFLNWAITGAI
jgi:membrane protease YdiL (CAAX protease family)